jgi:flagella basal body P-ring formation protein FlgA
MLQRPLLLLLAAGLLASGEVAIAIHAETWATGPRATLGQVAELTGDPAACATLGALTVAELPTLAAVQVDARLVTALATRAAAPATLRISGAGRVARRPRTFADGELYAAAAATVPGARTTPVRCSGALTVPDGATLVAEALDPQAIGETAFRVRAVEDGRESGRCLVVLRIEREIAVAVATRAIARGAVIGAEDVRSETRLATRPLLPAEVDPAGLVGCLARRDIAAGEPMLPGLVAVRPDVRAGSTITVLLPGRGFLVELQGTAQSDARAGERVAVRRRGDQALLNCIAQSDGTALVQP